VLFVYFGPLWGIFGTISMFFRIKMDFLVYTMGKKIKQGIEGQTKLLNINGHDEGIKQPHTYSPRDIWPPSGIWVRIRVFSQKI
jgi:hypothetical protein